MKVAIVGSREGVDDVRRKIEAYVRELPSDTVVVTGGARGADFWAEYYAEERGLETIVFWPEWDKHGKGAGFIRNRLIVDAADRVVAFWDGSSPGTGHTIGIAREQGKPVEVYS